MTVTLRLIRAALGDLLKPRRLFAAFILVAAPTVVAILIRVATREQFDGVATYGALAALLVFGFVLPILAVVFGTGVIMQEMEQKTIVYLLSRPVPRWRILVAKFAAAWLVTSITSVFAALLLAVATHEPGASTGQSRLYPEAVLDRVRLCSSLQLPETPVAEYVYGRLSDKTRSRLNAWDPATPPRARLVQSVINDLNRLIERDRNLYTPERFAGVQLPEDVRQMLTEKPRGEALARMNRLLLEAAFPDVFLPSRTTLGQVPRDILILPVGALAYGTLSVMLASLFSRAMIVGLFLAFGWESWVPMLPGNFRLVSIMTYLRALAPHARPEVASADLMGLFSALNPETVSASLAWVVLLSVSAVCLLSAVFLFSVREFVPRDDTA